MLVFAMHGLSPETNDLPYLLQRLLSNEEEKNKEIIQEVCFMVSLIISRSQWKDICHKAFVF